MGIRYSTTLILETDLVGRVDFQDLFAKVAESTE